MFQEATKETTRKSLWSFKKRLESPLQLHYSFYGDFGLHNKNNN